MALLLTANSRKTDTSTDKPFILVLLPQLMSQCPVFTEWHRSCNAGLWGHTMALYSRDSWTFTLTNMYFVSIVEVLGHAVYCSIACSSKLL